MSPAAHATGTLGILSSSELDRDMAGLQGTYGWATQSGAVTFTSGLTFAVAAVAAGDYTVNSVAGALYAGGSVVLSTQDPTNPRVDIIVITSAGTVSAVAGTPKALTTTSGPVPTAPSSSQLEIARIYVPASGTALTSANITDRRVPLPIGAMTYIRKPASETVNNSNTLQNDDDFVITVGVSVDYFVEAFLLLSGNVTADWKFGWALTNMTVDGTMDQGFTPNSVVATIQTIQGTASPAAQAITFATTAMTSTLFRAQFVIHSGATGGTLNFQWAQATADVSDTKVLKNSIMRYRILGPT